MCNNVVFFGQIDWKCFGIHQNTAIIITDCRMEPIYYNTKIPAVTVCPERDYWIFLNWSSIHLSIKKKKKRPECQHHSSCIECTWGVYNTQQDRYSSLLKRLIFKISLFQLYLVSIYHTVSGFPGIDHVETGNYMKVYVLTMFNSTQVLLKASTVLLPPSGRSQNCKYL